MDYAQLIKSIDNASAALIGENVPTEPERQKLVGAAESLVAKLKKPHEVILDISSASFRPAILRLAVEMKVLEIAAKAPEKTISLKRLSEESKVDEILLLRVLRVLTAMNLFTEHQDQRYTLTPLGSQLQPGSPYHSWIVIDDTNQQAIAKLTPYFIEKGFSNPSDTKDTPFNYAYKTKQTFFEYISSRPHLGTAFNHVMQFAKLLRGPDWYEFFPVADKLFSTTNNHTTPTLIDIGGGTGGDLLNFKKHHPAYPGRLILQDLPEVLADADSAALAASSIELIPHSFLHPQPASFHGATAYVIKNCLHDWPDAEAKTILSHLVAAMDEHSLLLVCETSLAQHGVPFMNAVFDWVMMIQFAGLDRMESQWRTLFQSVGLRIEKVWQSPVARFTVVFELRKVVSEA